MTTLLCILESLESCTQTMAEKTQVQRFVACVKWFMTLIVRRRKAAAVQGSGSRIFHYIAHRVLEQSIIPTTILNQTNNETILGFLRSSRHLLFIFLFQVPPFIISPCFKVPGKKESQTLVLTTLHIKTSVGRRHPE